jgi:CHAT domain-containing protein/Tfp pilus assembly protein PilF
MQHSEFDSALQQADQAAGDFARQDLAWHWKFRILAARAQIFRGQYKDAIDRLKPELPPQLMNGEVAVLRKMALANAEDLFEQFAAAEIDLSEAERLAPTSSPKIRMQVIQTRANLEFDQKKYPQAEMAFRKVLDIARELNLPASEQQTLGSLGNTAMEQEHYDEAADRYRASLRLAEESGRTFSVPTTLGNLGWSFYELGDYENAKESFRQAEQAASRAGERADRISWLTYLAEVDSETHADTEAKSKADEALRLARELHDPLTTVQALNASTIVALETNDMGSAGKYNREARELESGDFDHRQIVASLLNSGRIAERIGRMELAQQIYLKIRSDAGAQTSARWESEALLANVYREERRPTEAEREFRLCLRTVDEARKAVEREESRLSFLSGAIAFYGEYINFLISQGRTIEALQIAETSRARTLAEGLGSSRNSASGAFGAGELQLLSKRLNSVLLCYWLGKDRSHLWVITSQGTRYFPLMGLEAIDRAVKSYREALLESRDTLHPVNRDGTKLYTMLVEPAQDLIAKSTQVAILPDASLYGLNFETLIVPGETPHYWIEDVSITTASSLTLLAASVTRQPSATKKLLLIGNTEEASSEFPKLPQASAEMQTVERYFAEGDRDVLEGKEATPAAYLSRNPQRFAYLHFVTHGTASLTKPMESAVILSPGADNYKLYARDIVAHRLNANLVTISACNGAGTRAYSGEGLVGLSWAFLRAGAHNVIGALWEVDDRSTPQLMDALYDGLSKGKAPAAALRDAKLSFLHSGTVYSKPYYWAPFQLYAGS